MLPVTVLAVITAVLIIMFFYSEMQARCEMHIAMRSAAGALTEKTVYGHGGSWRGTPEVDRTPLGGVISGKGYVVMDTNGLIRGVTAGEVSGICHAVDGPKYVRYCSLLKESGVKADEE